MKKQIKGTIQGAIRATHLLACRRGLPDRVSFFFHALDPADWDQFRDSIQYFQEAGYAFVGPERFLANGDDVNGDEKLAFVSFDDNYRCWYDHLEVFRELGIGVTFYVNLAPSRDIASSEQVEAYFERLHYHGDRTTMTTDEIKELASAGHTIGNHTHSHVVLADVEPAVARQEIRRGKESLEDLLGTVVEHFAYPYGMRRHIAAEQKAYCEEIGMTSIATAIHGMHAGCVQGNQIHRTAWRLDRTVSYNVANLSVDGRTWERFTGRNAIT